MDVEVLGLTSLPVVGETYTVIDIVNSSISRITGDFMSPSGSDLFEGAKFSDERGFQWQISYQGGDGNDVVLTSLSVVPEPGSLVLLVSGLLAGAMARVVASALRGFRGGRCSSLAVLLAAARQLTR